MINKLEIKQLIIVLQLDENTTKEEFLQFLRQKILNPGLPYSEARQESENKQTIVENSTQEQEVESLTLPKENEENSNTEVETTPNTTHIEN